MALFSLLPGMGKIISKIPAVKFLGTKGAELLSKKLISQGTKAVFTTTENEILLGIKANEQLVKTEMDAAIKSIAKKAATSTTIKPIVKKTLINIGKTGLNLGTYYGAAKGYNATYDYFDNRKKEKALQDLISFGKFTGEVPPMTDKEVEQGMNKLNQLIKNGNQ